MPVSEKDFRDLSNDVAAIKTALGIVKALAGWLGSAAVIIGLAALGWCYHLGVKVAVLESGGNTKLITELKAPSSPQQLQAGLSTVIAQVQTARANGAKTNPVKVTALSSAVGDVLSRDSALPEAWHAASLLVDLRSDAASSQNISATPCFSRPEEVVNPHDAVPAMNILSLSNCTLALDNLNAFEAGGYGDTMRRLIEGNHLPPTLLLKHVRVVYHGGPVLPFKAFRFDNCEFVFETLQKPSEPGRVITEKLLAANDMNDVLALLT